MSEILMTAKELVDKHWYIVRECETIYMYAAYGFQVTDKTISGKAKQNLNGWYTEKNIAKLRRVANRKPPVWGFDCVNLLKGILWGWIGDAEKEKGGAVYGANGVPDTNANGMIKRCYDVTDDFSTIQPGEGLWLEGHWGLYVGDGLAIECTNSWQDGVQVTAVSNMGKQDGYKNRRWTKHGKLPWIDYGEATADKPSHSLGDRELKNGCKGADVAELQEDLILLGYDCGRWGPDGDFGDATEMAVRAFQQANGLAVDGIFGRDSLRVMEEALQNILEVPEEPKRVEIVGGNCWVRSAPTTDGNRLGVATAGSVWPYGGEKSENGWLLVEYKGSNGWVSGKYGRLCE